MNKDSFHDTLTRKQVFQTVEHLWNQSLKKYGNCRCSRYKHEVYRYQKSTGTDENGFCEMLLANSQCSLFILFLPWKYPITFKTLHYVFHDSCNSIEWTAWPKSKNLFSLLFFFFFFSPNQMIVLQKSWKMLFISSKKLFLLFDKCKILIFFSPFPHLPDSKGQRKVE